MNAMNTIVILFVVGILFLVFEVIMPGAVLGIMGAVAMLAGVIISFTQYGVPGGIIATVSALGVLGLALYIEFILLPKTKLGQRLFVHSKVDSTSQPPVAEAESVVGKSAEALTTLAPSGYVAIGGRRYEAFCQSGHAVKGERLQVTGIDNFRLIVTKS